MFCYFFTSKTSDDIEVDVMKWIGNGGKFVLPPFQILVAIMMEINITNGAQYSIEVFLVC